MTTHSNQASRSLPIIDKVTTFGFTRESAIQLLLSQYRMSMGEITRLTNKEMRDTIFATTAVDKNWCAGVFITIPENVLDSEHVRQSTSGTYQLEDYLSVQGLSAGESVRHSHYYYDIGRNR